jgi:membrane associated rhomboid family serine protease
MWQRQTSGSVICPSCGSLVGVNDEACLICGRRRPGLFGFAALLRNVGRDMGFVPLVLWGCGALYLATLASNAEGIRMNGILSMLSPSNASLFLFGASGAVPVFGYGRWWTVLSAAWLHGGILHILFNMMAVRNLAPVTAHLYGAARTVIIYTVAAITGFLASSTIGAFAPSVLGGARITVGASAPLCGLIGALWWYGHRGGSSQLTQQVKQMAVGLVVIGFVLPGIDNWAHLGGLAGGWVTARILDPLTPERGDHVLIALLCLALSVASVAASIVVGLPG